MTTGTIISIVIISVIALAFAAVVAVSVINKKRGKHTCSCGGACASCPAACACHGEEGGKK